MERHGGGWTLVAVVSDDNQENWTWDNRNYWDTDTTTFGSVGQPHKDFKSAALHDLAFTDLLFVHAPSGEWASYNGVGDGEETLAAHIGAYGEEPRQEMRLADYLERWSRGDAAGSYLKDWHFVRDCPGAAAYSTPAPFADDWLNWWWTERRGGEDDYRFVYLGPAG